MAEEITQSDWPGKVHWGRGTSRSTLLLVAVIAVVLAVVTAFVITHLHGRVDALREAQILLGNIRQDAAEEAISEGQWQTAKTEQGISNMNRWKPFFEALTEEVVDFDRAVVSR